MRRAALGVCAALLAACEEKAAPPLSSLAPKPLPKLAWAADGGEDREAVYRVEAAPVWGEPRPASAVTLELRAGKAQVGSQTFDLETPESLARLKAAIAGRPLLVVPDRDTYLAQLGHFLGMVDEGGLELWLAHLSQPVAFRVRLRDEAAFRLWLDEPKPGKIRIIQRADGLELQTNIGKLPGADPNGPTVPLRGGQLDVAGARRALSRLKERFDEAQDVCVVPSFGTELGRVADVLTADYAGPRERSFDELCLVYPRPAARDGG
jgi:hypothetical protein